MSVTNDPNIHVDFCSHATLISEHKLWAATFGTDPPDEGTPAARWRPIKFPAGARQAVEDLQRKASGLPTNQERKDAELALEAVIAQLPVETDVWNHLPAFKHFAGRLFDIAAETQLRNGAPDRGLLDGLVAEVVDAVLSKDAKPDEWWRFARKGSRFPFERVILREELRQYLTKNRFSYWFRRYSLVVEATIAEHAVETTAPADPDSRMALDDSGASESPTPDADVPDKGRASIRRAWMDQRHPGWSIPQWREHTGIAYETLRKYWDGVTTNRTRTIRADLARAEEVEFSTVPE